MLTASDILRKRLPPRRCTIRFRGNVAIPHYAFVVCRCPASSNSVSGSIALRPWVSRVLGLLLGSVTFLVTELLYVLILLALVRATFSAD